MRLFISVNFDDETKANLINVQEILRSHGVKGNYTREENLHMTLAFIGDYGDPYEVLDVLDSVSFPDITLKFSQLSFFRDMYFAIIKDDPKLTGYVRRLRDALSKSGIPFDRKKFLPHITLIRKVSLEKADLAGLPEFEPFDFMAERASLMRSERGKNGMIYTEIM